MARRINGKLISYDYSELLRELAMDIEEFNVSTLGIVRGKEREGYKPIIDYYLPNLDLINEPVEIVNVEDVLEEMQELNSIM